MYQTPFEHVMGVWFSVHASHTVKVISAMPLKNIWRVVKKRKPAYR